MKFEDMFKDALAGTSTNNEESAGSLDINTLLEMAEEMKQQPKQQMIMMDADMMRSLQFRPEFRTIEETGLNSFNRSMFYGMPVYGIEKLIIEKRHKKKRINKKLNKKYGPKIRVEFVKNPAHSVLTSIQA